MNAAIETDRLAWRPALEVGVKEIDSQHQELFALFNSTLEAARADEPGQMAIHLETLGNRTAAHFAFEQEQFAGLDPALREEHIEEHRKLLDEFGEQVDDWRDKKISTREIVRFVSIWLVRHIAALDISTFKQIAKGTSSPRE